MSSTEVSVNAAGQDGWYESVPFLIVGISLVIAVIAFLYGLSWLKRRRSAHEREHLVVDMAEPESLRDLPEERRP
ncbi:MAG TPA: hypothetical protein VGB08_08910 [Allosphingosinicella sp.]|jgi:hypothetical protein